MFPLMDVLNAFQQAGRNRARPSCFQNHPRYNPTQFAPCSGGLWNVQGSDYPDYQQCMNAMYPGVVNILQKIVSQTSRDSEQDKNRNKKREEEKQQKSAEQPENEKRSKKDDKRCSTDEKDTEHVTVAEILNHVLSVCQGHLPPTDAKWETNIDCRGFLTKNIKVKIEGKQLLIKAFRKEESGDGLRTMSMRKSVALPDNIDAKHIACKLSPSGLLHIQAPYETEKASEINDKTLKDLVNQFAPGLAALFHGLADDTGDDASNEKNNFNCKNIDENLKQEDNKASTSVGEKKVDHDSDSNSCFKSDQQDANKMKINDNANKGIDKNMKNEVSDDEYVGSESPCSQDSVNSLAEVETTTTSEVPEDQSKSSDIATTTEEQTVPLPELHLVSQTDTHANDGSESVATEDSFVRLSEFKNIEDQDMYANDNLNTNPSNSDELNSTNTSSAGNDIGVETNYEIENVIFRLEMPSYDPSSVRVSFDESNRTLTVTAGKGKNGNPSFSEISKSTVIGDDVDTNSLHCFFKDGSLSVTAPLKQKSSIQNIPINF